MAADPEKKLLHYATGGHGADMFPVHAELPALIADWFVTTLLKTPGHAPVPKEAPAIPRGVLLLNTIDQPGGPAKARQQLEEARRRDAKAALFPEALVNVIGYECLQAGDTKNAVEILKLNATAYPQSPNAYDSLSDAYMADGQKELARQNAEKALQLLLSDTTDNEQQRKDIKESAEEKLKQLRL